MSKTLLAGMLALGLAACASAAAKEPAHRDADQPFGKRALERTVVVGTLVQATIHTALSWRHDRPGETLAATVSADVTNAGRWIVIPAGSPVGLTIREWGSTALLLDVSSVTVWGQVYVVRATVELTPLGGVLPTGSDVVVAPGTPILFVLSEGITVEQRPVGPGTPAHAGPTSE
jgi:hypothetical protein